MLYNKDENKKNILEYSSLNLAYLGDAVFEILIRDQILKSGNRPVKILHKEAENYVKATAQSKMYSYIFEYLTEGEKKILERGRNAKSFTKAKNASVIDYRRATGVEALFGFLYLQRDTKRINEIFTLCLETIKN